MTERIPVYRTPRLWVRHHPGALFHCPGCHHPLIEKLVCEVIEELGIEGRTVGVAGVGCNHRFIIRVDTDGINTAHGRAPDVATGIKRALGKDIVVYTIEGDGDCIAIGASSLINAAARAERITVIMANNANYGTTGGQMAPTTLIGQVTSTTPNGRDPERDGFPIRTAELLAGIRGVCYSARGSVHTPANYQKTKKYLKKAFQKQMDGIGFSFVEILSACPTDWRLSPIESIKFIEERMLAEFPLGEFKDVSRLE